MIFCKRMSIIQGGDERPTIYTKIDSVVMMSFETLSSKIIVHVSSPIAHPLRRTNTVINNITCFPIPTVITEAPPVTLA